MAGESGSINFTMIRGNGGTEPLRREFVASRIEDGFMKLVYDDGSVEGFKLGRILQYRYTPSARPLP